MTPGKKEVHRARTYLRYGVEISLGIVWVVIKLSLRDTIRVLGPKNLPVTVSLTTRHNENDNTSRVDWIIPASQRIVDARNTVLRRAIRQVTLKTSKTVKLDAIRTDPSKPAIVTQLLIEDPASSGAASGSRRKMFKAATPRKSFTPASSAA